MSKVSAIYHIVINTKNRRKSIPDSKKRDLYKYIYAIIKNNDCVLLRINGIANHIHILVELHQTVALSTLVKSIKQSSSRWLSGNADFPLFEGWGREYFAATIHRDMIEQVKQYIINQDNHHAKINFEDEVKEFCRENGIIWHDGALS